MQTTTSSHRTVTVCLWCLLLTFVASMALRAEEPAHGLIDVKSAGSGAGGQAVLLIPGLATPGSIWDETVAALQKDHAVYVVTLAGFGGMSPVAKRDHYLTDVRDAIVGYAREHKLEHPVIVGHSLGGVLALDLAATAPELPGKVVVVDSLPFLAAMMAPGVDSEADAKQLAVMVGEQIGAANAEKFAADQKQFVGGMVTSPEKAAAIAAQTGKSDPATVGQAMTELLARDLRPELHDIKCPVLVLGAVADKLAYGLTRASVEKAYRAQYTALPQAKFQFFDGARHFIMVDDPAGFQAALQKEMAEAP